MKDAVSLKGISQKRKMKAVAKKKKFVKEQDKEEYIESAGGNTNANADKYKNATCSFLGRDYGKEGCGNKG